MSRHSLHRLLPEPEPEPEPNQGILVRRSWLSSFSVLRGCPSRWYDLGLTSEERERCLSPRWGGGVGKRPWEHRTPLDYSLVTT